MGRLSLRLTKIFAPQGAMLGSDSADRRDRKIVGVGVLLTALVLAYFYAADKFFFSTRFMALIFQYLLIVNDSKTAWLVFGVCVLATLWRNPSFFLRVADFLGAHEIYISMAATALFLLGSIYVYRGVAFSMDEYAAVFQAKIFAAGRLTAQLPPSVIDWLLPPGFNGAFVVASRTSGRAIEAYWPGFSLLLAPFEYIGIPGLCNATLSGIAILLIHRITLEITHERRAAGWAVAFTVCSGAFIANAISLYSMQAHLTANLLFAWLLLKPTARRAFGAGVVGSLALVLHNPFPHTMFAAPWIISMMRSDERRPFLFPLIAGYIPLLLALGVGWMYLRELITAGDSGFNVIGNNLTAVFALPDKSMLDMRVAALVKMWIWAVPCLFLLAGLGRIRRGDDWRVRLLMQSAVTTFCGYVFFIYDQGHGWGYRYFHSAWGGMPILAACAMSKSTGPSGRLISFAGAAAALNLVLVIPFQMMQIEGTIALHSAQLPPPRRPGNDVYFVHSSGGFYLSDLVQMDPLLRSNDLILFSGGAEPDAELRRQNWPKASVVERGSAVEEWNLGPDDQRTAPKSAEGIKRFEFAYSAPASQAISKVATPVKPSH